VRLSGRVRYAVYALLLIAAAVAAGRGASPAGEWPAAPGRVARASEPSGTEPFDERVRLETRVQAPGAAPSRPDPDPTEAYFRTGRRARVRVADSIEAFLSEPSLGAEQISDLKEASAAKQQELAALQSEAYEGAVSADEAEHRARAIQEAFERRLGTVLTPDQWQRYRRLQREGRVGTYAVLIPGRVRRF
jgi:hypothetical protein